MLDSVAPKHDVVESFWLAAFLKIYFAADLLPQVFQGFSQKMFLLNL